MGENGHNKQIELPGSITVRELAESIEASPIEVIKTLMANGVMANINQQIDFDTAAIVAAEMGYDATLETQEGVAEDEIGEIPLWRQVIAGEAVLAGEPAKATTQGQPGDTGLGDDATRYSQAVGLSRLVQVAEDRTRSGRGRAGL